MITREALACRLAEINHATDEIEKTKKALALPAVSGDTAALTEFKRLRSMQRALEDDAEPISLALQQLS